MICETCNKIIPDSSTICPFCNSYTIQAQDKASKFSLSFNDEIIFIPSKKTPFIIGRKDINQDPDVDLGPYDTNLTISRKHGFFIEKDGDLFYIDTSTNGSILNNNRLLVNKKYILKDKDVLELGEIRITIIEKK